MMTICYFKTRTSMPSFKHVTSTEVLYAKREIQNMSRCILANLVTARRGADMVLLSISEQFGTTVIICVRTDMQISHALYQTGFLFELTPCDAVLENRKNIVVSHLVKKRFAFYVIRRFIQQMSLP